MERGLTPRRARIGDEAALMALWKTVFGAEDEAFAALFFRTVYAPENTAVIEADGKIVSCAYAIAFGGARYIYAVSTHPDYRSRGFGRAVTLAAADGGSAYLSPADEKLRAWYEKSMGAYPVSRRALRSPRGELRELTAEEYIARREALLADTPHAEYSDAIAALFLLSGKFYADELGVLAVEDGKIKESLPVGEGKEVYVLGLNGAPPLYWGLTLD